MKKLLVVLDDETADLLAKEKNMSHVVRESVKYMKRHITPDTLEGMRLSYAQLTKQINEIDSKVNYIAARMPK